MSRLLSSVVTLFRRQARRQRWSAEPRRARPVTRAEIARLFAQDLGYRS